MCSVCFGRGLSRCFCKNKKPSVVVAGLTNGGQQLLSISGKPVASLESAEDLKNERLQAARVVARQGRDCRARGNEALVNLWREVSKPRKGGAIPAMPPGCKVDSQPLFQEWLDRRGLTDALEYSGNQQGWDVYRYTRDPVVKSEPHWEQAFHGTWWYSVWLLLETGIFLESDDKGLGHDFWEPGTYCSPSLDTGLWYARPQVLFNDGVYHRIIFELRVNPERRRKNRARGGIQWVFPCGAVALHAVWIRSNAPPNNGEERVYGWEADLEALPPGWAAPEPLVNTRTDPWPDIPDPHPFVGGWLGASGGKSGINSKAAAAAAPTLTLPFFDFSKPMTAPEPPKTLLRPTVAAPAGGEAGDGETNGKANGAKNGADDWKKTPANGDRSNYGQGNGSTQPEKGLFAQLLGTAENGSAAQGNGKKKKNKGWGASGGWGGADWGGDSGKGNGKANGAAAWADGSAAWANGGKGAWAGEDGWGGGDWSGAGAWGPDEATWMMMMMGGAGGVTPPSKKARWW